MNERIKELAEQAGASVDESTLAFAVVFGEISDFERFAQLIVKEHINLLRQAWYDLNNEPKTEDETPREVGIRVGRKTQVVALINKINNHFGVEE